MPNQVNLNVPVYLGSSPSTQSNGLREMDLVVVSGSACRRLRCAMMEKAWVDKIKSRAACELECKRNCSCSAYSIIGIPGKGDSCLTWYKELVDIRYERSGSDDLYVRVDAYEL
ncbi:hypothetical protein OIU78_024579, partial [Salix suchowensis]